MKVIEVKQTTKMQSHYSLSSIDFEDCFATINRIDDLEKVVDLIFRKTPNWVSFLMKFRNFLVRFIGLKTENPTSVNTNFEVGSYIGFFQIMSIKPNEIVLGANDSHLNFRALIVQDSTLKYNINVTTLVEFNNRKGRLYFKVIGPFHKLVVRRMVKQAYKA